MPGDLLFTVLLLGLAIVTAWRLSRKRKRFSPEDIARLEQRNRMRL